MSGHDQLSLEAAERAFDGPLPEPLRRVLRAGSARRAIEAQANAEIRFLTMTIRQQLASLRALRGSGGETAALRRDLVIYRRARQRWRRTLDQLI